MHSCMKPRRGETQRRENRCLDLSSHRGLWCVRPAGFSTGRAKWDWAPPGTGCPLLQVVCTDTCCASAVLLSSLCLLLRSFSAAAVWAGGSAADCGHHPPAHPSTHRRPPTQRRRWAIRHFNHPTRFPCPSLLHPPSPLRLPLRPSHSSFSRLLLLF